MANIYDRQRLGKFVFLIVSIITITIFLIISNNLVKDLAAQERERMDIWASAMQHIVQNPEDIDNPLYTNILSENKSIPVLVTDEDCNISECHNFELPHSEDEEKSYFSTLHPKNQEYLAKHLKNVCKGKSLMELSESDNHFIRIEVYPELFYYIYYEDSSMLQRLSWYPYVQMSAMIILIIIIYFAVIYTKKAEQNRVWVGLSKETAHQLGTPISSLMAWSQLLESYGVDKEIVSEMDKDVTRLSVIADRFSKIGSRPELTLEYLNDSLVRSLEYMKSRVSDKVEIKMFLSENDHGVMLSTPLFAWVMENLTKNAVDAMDGAGTITISSGEEHDKLFIEVIDTGKGILRKNFKNVFNPGFTTKKRGWGLGLTLVKRIIEEYHDGKIFVKESEIGRGTTFRIELPSPVQNSK